MRRYFIISTPNCSEDSRNSTVLYSDPPSVVLTGGEGEDNVSSTAIAFIILFIVSTFALILLSVCRNVHSVRLRKNRMATCEEKYKEDELSMC